VRSQGPELRKLRALDRKSTLARVGEWLNGESAGIELRVLRRLEETFVPHGVCAAMAMQL
jgi:hypothetical protein